MFEEETSTLNTYINQAPDLIVTYGTKILLALLVFIIGKYLVKVMTNLMASALEKNKVDVTICRFVKNISYYALLTLVVIAALGQLGVQTASFVAVIGAAGLAVGFALQGSLSNFASGVLLILFRPFKAGDYIEAGGASGSVEEISIFNTVLKTPDNKIVIIANSAVMGGNIVNYSAEETRRVDLLVGVSYDADIKQTRAALEEIANNEPLILKDKEITIAVSELADSSVNFVFRVWVNTPDYWTVYFNLHEAVKLRLDDLGIGIPYPQMDLHVVNMPGN